MKSFLTGTKTPISIFSVSVKPSESVGNAVVVPFGPKVVFPNVVKTRYSQTIFSVKLLKINLHGLWIPSQRCSSTSVRPEINLTSETCMKQTSVSNMKS